MAQQNRRLSPGQSLNDAPTLPAPTLPAPKPPTPSPGVMGQLRNRGSEEEMVRGLERLEASGSTEAEMRSYATKFVITDPDKQANLDQWRDDPWGYARDTISNVPGNAWEMLRGIPTLGRLVVDAPAEAAVRGIGTIADLLGKKAPVSPYSRGESLEAVAGMPSAIWDDLVSSYSTPEGFATHVKENPAGLAADIFGGVAASRGVAPTLRAANKISQNPQVAASVVGLATLGTTFDLMQAFRNASIAWSSAKARRTWDLYDKNLTARNAAIRDKSARETAEAQRKALAADAKAIIKAKEAHKGEGRCGCEDRRRAILGKQPVA
jgi:hypothetical protein